MSVGASAGRSALRADQLSKLNALIAALVPNNPFYTRKLLEAGVARGVESLEHFTEAMPFTSKAEIVEDQRIHPPYGTNLTFPIERYTRYSQTSATTGAPLRWLDTPDSWNWMMNQWDRVFQEAGVSSVDRIFFAFSFGPFLGFWTAFDAAVRRGCLALPGGGLSTTARLRVILDNAVTVVCCTPTYAIRLGEVAPEEGIDLGEIKVRTVIVAGEPGGSIPATRHRIQELWRGARVFDHHGMTEVGPVSFESADHAGVLHIIESAYLAEVIDPNTGKSSVSGEIGELVLTTLGRIGSPLLRYRTGDLVKPLWDSLPLYGRPEVALEGGILGRTDDMLVIRGVNVSPATVEELIRSQPGVLEYRVELRNEHGMAEMKVLVEPVAGLTETESLCHRIEAAFRMAFNLRVPVEAVPEGQLPRFEMKAKRWVKVQTEPSHG
jgi:phenylacetate-CoA ligase